MIVINKFVSIINILFFFLFCGNLMSIKLKKDKMYFNIIKTYLYRVSHLSIVLIFCKCVV